MKIKIFEKMFIVTEYAALIHTHQIRKSDILAWDRKRILPKLSFFVMYSLFRITSVQYMYHNLSISIYLKMAQYFIKTRINMTEAIEVRVYIPKL